MPAWGVLTTEQLVVMDTRLPRMPLRAELCSKTIQMANMAAPLMYAAMVVVKAVLAARLSTLVESTGVELQLKPDQANHRTRAPSTIKCGDKGEMMTAF